MKLSYIFIKVISIVAAVKPFRAKRVATKTEPALEKNFHDLAASGCVLLNYAPLIPEPTGREDYVITPHNDQIYVEIPDREWINLERWW